MYAFAGANNSSIHIDFVSPLAEGVDTMWIQLGPDTSNINADEILNGLEIFKLSNKNSLVGNPRKIKEAGSQSVKTEKSKIIWTVVGAGAGGIAITVAVIVGLCLFCRKKKSTSVKPHSPGWLPLFLHAGSETTYASKASRGTVNSASISAPVRRGR